MLIDAYGRKIDYLRISVTDRCNLRCIYCMPECGIVHKPHAELLTFEEIIRITRACVSLGIDKVRLTGGEPLVRKDLVSLINSLHQIDGLKDISMTTNGILLKGRASELKQAGLQRINVSLNSLRPERYKFITRQGNLSDALEGIREILEAGFSAVKINILLLERINEDEIRDFLRLTFEHPLCVRFLEFMPVNSFYRMENFVSGRAVLEIAKRFGAVESAEASGCGPATVYKFKQALGTFGLIAPMSHKFCASCNRLRLSADGCLKVCLHSDLKVNLRQHLRAGAGSPEELLGLIKLAARMKPKEHSLEKENSGAEEFSMCQIGG